MSVVPENNVLSLTDFTINERDPAHHTCYVMRRLPKLFAYKTKQTHK